IAEDVFRPSLRAARAALSIQAGLAEAIIDRTLLGIVQRLVRFRQLLELRFGDGAARIATRVIFHRLLAEGGLQRLLVSVLGDAENVIKRALAHRDDRTEIITTLSRSRSSCPAARGREQSLWASRPIAGEH